MSTPASQDQHRSRPRGGGLVALVALVGMVVAGLAVAGPAGATSLSAGGPYSGAEGQHIDIQGTGDGSASYTWTAVRSPQGEKDGASCQVTDPASLSTTVWCNDDGAFLVTLTGSDGVSSTAKLMLTNVDPAVRIQAPVTGTAVGTHAVVRLAAGYTDPGPVDSHRYTISWGDGTSSRASTTEKLDGHGSISGAHSYATAGNRTITVTVSDSHHGSAGRASVGITVVGGKPCYRVSGKGRLPRHKRSSFSLSAHCGSAGPVGGVSLSLPGHGRLAAKRVTLLRGRSNTATFAGTGRWERSGTRTWTRGYRYLVTVVDRGRNTRTRHDWMRVTVRRPSGALVLRVKGPIAGGNIIVRR